MRSFNKLLPFPNTCCIPTSARQDVTSAQSGPNWVQFWSVYTMLSPSCTNHSFFYYREINPNILYLQECAIKRRFSAGCGIWFDSKLAGRELLQVLGSVVSPGVQVISYSVVSFYFCPKLTLPSVRYSEHLMRKKMWISCLPSTP